MASAADQALGPTLDMLKADNSNYLNTPTEAKATQLNATMKSHVAALKRFGLRGQATDMEKTRKKFKHASTQNKRLIADAMQRTLAGLTAGMLATGARRIVFEEVVGEVVGDALIDVGGDIVAEMIVPGMAAVGVVRTVRRVARGEGRLSDIPRLALGVFRSFFG